MDLLARIRRRLRPAAVPHIGGYDRIEPWADRPGFYTATHKFSAEPQPVPLLLRVVPGHDKQASLRLMQLAKRYAKLQSPYFPRACDLGRTAEVWYLVLHIDPPVRPLSAVDVDGLTLVRQIAEGLSYLHHQGLACRGLSSDSIALAGSGHPVLFDLWWAAGLGADRIVPSVLRHRQRRPCDPPEANKEYDGVRGDVYALGVLATDIGVPDRYHALVRRMTHTSAAERPSSMDAVLRELAS